VEAPVVGVGWEPERNKTDEIAVNQEVTDNGSAVAEYRRGLVGFAGTMIGHLQVAARTVACRGFWDPLIAREKAQRF
jgi:hypothetical protein